ncbi:hypothetical protein ACFV0R_23490 [Streptomyces sp. NPDC059578]|uniref:hypothetical protein n=1 Tax=unclassified Streptomyces TaxID=2593676 RepID=UPI00364865AF
MSGTDARLLEDEELLRMALSALRGKHQALEADRDAAVTCPVAAAVGDQGP